MDCISFLQDVLPRMGYRWRGFKNVHGQVCKRITARIRELKLRGFEEYRSHLRSHAEEWAVLDGLCVVTISRFYRDRAVFDRVRFELLPSIARAAVAQGLRQVSCASLGCASGEEVYTLRAAWLSTGARELPDVELTVLGIDKNEQVLERARRGLYEPGSLREMPSELIGEFFEREPTGLRAGEQLRRNVRFEHVDLRAWRPAQTFSLVLCRNLAFTYFDEPTQLRIAREISERMNPGGVLVLGGHEVLPEDCSAWRRQEGAAPIYISQRASRTQG